TPLNVPEMLIIANISAAPLESIEARREEMEGHLTSSVRWSETVQWMIDNGVDTFVEIGSKDVLRGLIRQVDKSVNAVAIGTPDNIKSLI
ncbi:MAG: ACP S-malonyltransferase, partial [Anaerolineae bacterium]|nr:ACP S-malonyltransferase [Anaerolineae bacterium]